MSDFVFWSATQLSQAIRTQTLSAEEVMQAYLDRITAVNPALNAIVQIAPNALEKARQADAAIARGDKLGVLHGVPFTVKDIFDTAGIVSAAGLEERRNFVPAQDATVVSRLKAAGGILLGKTNCPPAGGGGWTDNPVYGRTNNPYDGTRTPSGSSGGEAVAIAAGLSAVGVGSDSGGSLRLPAHFCGIATLRPTVGRIPNTGALYLPGGLTDPRSQIGPMARYVADLALLLPLLAGEDGVDSGVVPMPLAEPTAVSLANLRIAYYLTDGEAEPTPAIQATVQSVADALAQAGYSVSQSRPACLLDSRPITERYWGMAQLNGAEVEQLYLDWDRYRSEMLTFWHNFDVLLTPVDYHPADLHEQSAPLRFNYTLPFSLTNWPTAVVRAGSSPKGLPIGIQVVARPWREEIVLATAQWVETQFGGWQAPLI